MRYFILSCGLAALISSGALAQDKDWKDTPLDEREGKSCISTSHIDRTDVLDDQTIIFEMRGRDIYVNKMRHRCPSLAFEDRFTYSTSTNQLCSTDIITVLRPAGSGLMAGPSCGLDKFIPITKDEVKTLKADIKKAKEEKRKEKKGDQ